MSGNNILHMKQYRKPKKLARHFIRIYHNGRSLVDQEPGVLIGQTRSKEDAAPTSLWLNANDLESVIQGLMEAHSQLTETDLD